MPLRILGSRIDHVSSSEAVERIFSFSASPESHHIITGNTLMLLDAEKDPELRSIMERSALVVPESSGIYWASRRLGQPLKEFIPGIDLFLELCRRAAEGGQSIYLLGARPGIAEIAGRELQRRYPDLRIAGTHHGYFKEAETPDVLKRLHAAAPQFLFVAMSVPAQEKWIARHLATLNVPVVMGVGGSFDVLSGHLKRAPVVFRRLGLEWLYRLWQEPWRWRRIARLPWFALKVIFTST